MTDIVERLRQASLNQGDYRWEAADEIERLRAALDEAANDLANEGNYAKANKARAALGGKDE